MTVKHNPLRIIVLSFLFVILFGSILFLLPYSFKNPISLTDALFMSTSAVCVTGLSVVDINNFTLFGQLVLLFLIQIGGLGYMSITTFFLLSFKKKISYEDKLILKESLSYPSFYGLLDFLKRVILFVFLSEFIGSIILAFSFYHKLGMKGVYYGIFHAVSAFNNAGFSLFNNSLIGFKYNIAVNFTIMALIILGGIGFLVVDEIILYKTKKIKRLSLHTYIVLSSTVILIIAGAILMFVIEKNHALQSGSFFKDTLLSLFQSVTTRTAGFNTIDLTLMHNTTIFIFIVLMFIGASPSGTGGGIKTTTAAIVFLSIYSYIKGEKDTTIFKRRVAETVVKKSFVIVTLSIIIITLSALILSDFEHYRFINVLFEAVSAVSTVGLSISNHLSLSSQFSDFGKIIITILMFVGRIGIFSFSIALFRKRNLKSYKLPEGRIFT